MEKYDLKNKKIGLHNVVFAITTIPDCEMSRIILLEDLEDIKMDECVVVSGYHCSCYDFDDCEWEVIKYKIEELKKLSLKHLKNNFNGCDKEEKDLYKFVLEYYF